MLMFIHTHLRLINIPIINEDFLSGVESWYTVATFVYTSVLQKY